MAGAIDARDKRIFAISEDIFAAGLLLAHLSLAPFCAPKSIDFSTVQRYGLQQVPTVSSGRRTVHSLVYHVSAPEQ